MQDILKSEKLTCDICANTEKDLRTAIVNGWQSEYYDGEDNPCGPVCGKCWDLKWINVDPIDGELILTELGRRAINAQRRLGKPLKVESYGYPN